MIIVNHMRLKDKVAIVTGASSDIGLAIVTKFVEEGAQVVMIGRKLDALKKAALSLGNNSKQTVALPCDITNEGQVIQTIDQVYDHYGKIDILVNNAGTINEPKHFHEMSDSDWMSLIETNMIGTFRITRAVLSKMLEKKTGSIINIGSISAERAIPKVHLTVYCATKAAINMFTKGIAVEYARRNIRCNCINPGIINAGMIKSYLDILKQRKS